MIQFEHFETDLFKVQIPNKMIVPVPFKFKQKSLLGTMIQVHNLTTDAFLPGHLHLYDPLLDPVWY